MNSLTMIDQVTAGKVLPCCFDGCDKMAKFIVIDTGDSRKDVAETHACETHVGVLIGSVEPTKPKGPWSVYIL